MKFHAITDVGRMRSQNQDNVYGTTSPIGPLPNLFLVADGMGGHNAGDYASRRAIELVKESVEQSPGTEPVEVLRTAITTANDMLFSEARQQEEKSGMGTTFVAATIVNEELLVANVGDSRLYLISGGAIRQITRDHSYVEEMVAMGRMDRGSEYYNSHKNIITRAMGIERAVEADFFEAELHPGDYFLLCSDGLTNMVDDGTICRIVTGGGSLKDKAARLIGEANRQGGVDNIAVVLVRPEEGGGAVC